MHTTKVENMMCGNAEATNSVYASWSNLVRTKCDCSHDSSSDWAE